MRRPIVRVIVGAGLAVAVGGLVAWTITARVSASGRPKPQKFHHKSTKRGDDSCYRNQFVYVDTDESGLTFYGFGSGDGSGHAAFKTSTRGEKEAGGGTITWGFDGSVQGPNLLKGSPQRDANDLLINNTSDIDALLNVLIVWDDGATFVYVSKCALEFQVEHNGNSPSTDFRPNGNGTVEVETEGHGEFESGRYHWEGDAVASVVQEDGPLLMGAPTGHLNLQIEPGRACREGKEIVHISIDLGEDDEAGGTSNNLEVDNPSEGGHGRAVFPWRVEGKPINQPSDCKGFN